MLTPGQWRLVPELSLFMIQGMSAAGMPILQMFVCQQSTTVCALSAARQLKCNFEMRLQLVHGRAFLWQQ